MPKHDWEKFRADIERLYIVEDKALVEVVEILATMKGFRARSVSFRLMQVTNPTDCESSKSAFEKRLRQWGLCKYNMGQEKWNAVARIIEKRKMLGLTSDIYVRGVKIPQDKVQREISRNVALTLRSKFATSLSKGIVQTRCYQIIKCNTLLTFQFRLPLLLNPRVESIFAVLLLPSPSLRRIRAALGYSLFYRCPNLEPTVRIPSRLSPIWTMA